LSNCSLSIANLPLFIFALNFFILIKSVSLIFTLLFVTKPSELSFIRTASEKQVKSKFLVVCKGNSWKMGKMTLTISFNFFTVKTAELQFLFIFTTPTPNVLAIFFLRTPMSSTCKFILNTKLTEVQLLLGWIEKQPSASTKPTNHSNSWILALTVP
jgi:hypothetical protein